MENKHLWLKTFFFSLISMYFIGIYLYFENGIFSMKLINRANAWNAVVLIGLSLGLSGLCYFWNSFDSKIIYRKHLGVIGFGYACAHALLSVMRVSENSNVFEYFLRPENQPAFFAAVISLSLLGFLTLISNETAIHLLGGKTWKYMMRLGYVAYIFAIMHFFLKTYQSIFAWLKSGSLIPPIAASLFIFALCVLVLRIFVSADSKVKKGTQSKV